MMSRKLKLVIALSLLIIMSGFASGQAVQRSNSPNGQIAQARIPPRGGNPRDPCSPSFIGTVFIPCNTPLGALVLNGETGRYDVRLDQALLKQAYASIVEQTRQLEKSSGQKIATLEYGSWVQMLMDTFGQFANEAGSDRSRGGGNSETGETAMRQPPTFTGGVGYGNGGWSFNAGFSWTLGKK